MPFDLSDDSGADQSAGRSSSPQAAPPGVPRRAPGAPPASGGPGAGRASDVFQSPGQATGATPFLISERPGTPFDSAASSVFWLALIVAVVGLAYLLWGVWSASLADPKFSHAFAHADRARVLGNLHTVGGFTELALLVAVAAALFLYYDASAIGYLLALVAIILYVGVPQLSGLFLSLQHAKPSQATNFVVQFINRVAYVPGVPGVLLIMLDLARRAVCGLQVSRVGRAKLRYGQNVVSHGKRRNVFLGPCWNMPYCREAVRNKCKIHIKHRGPCWWHKEGCMCEESVILVASSPGDWKASVAGAVAKIDGGAASAAGPGKNPLLGFSSGDGKPKLTPAEKAQRCRECVIYNTHQEQKYKALSTAVIAGVAVLILAFNAPVLGLIGGLITDLNGLLRHFSLDNHGGATALALSASSGPGPWFILVVFALLGITKLLQLVEYCCFTLKI